MTYNPDIHHRHSIRLREYDYSSVGAYFVTICAQGRECLFGDFAAGELRLNDAGRMVAEWWGKLPEKFPHVTLEEYVIMPNHFHGIVMITAVGAPPCGCPPLTSKPRQPHGDCPCVVPKSGRPHGAVESGSPRGAVNNGQPHGVTPTVGDLMDWFKTMTTNAYIKSVKLLDWPPFPGRLWQRNYYERIIRNDAELAAIQEYILFNPVNWAEDEEYPT